MSAFPLNLFWVERESDTGDDWLLYYGFESLLDIKERACGEEERGPHPTLTQTYHLVFLRILLVTCLKREGGWPSNCTNFVNQLLQALKK